MWWPTLLLLQGLVVRSLILCSAFSSAPATPYLQALMLFLTALEAFLWLYRRPSGLSPIFSALPLVQLLMLARLPLLSETVVHVTRMALFFLHLSHEQPPQPAEPHS